MGCTRSPLQSIRQANVPYEREAPMSAPETRGSDPGLRERLHQAADAAAPRPIDVDAVLAASRARRRARRTAALGVTATAAVLLAAGGIAIAVNGLGPDAASNSALTSESAGT